MTVELIEQATISPRIAAVFSGSPVWSVYEDDHAVRVIGAHVRTGSQVTYRGSAVEFHGPFAVIGRCACDQCIPDDLDLMDTFRLVITNGEDELTCVRPESVTGRTVG